MRNKRFINRDEVIRRLQDSQGGKSQVEFSGILKISQPLLSAVYAKKRDIPKEVLDHLRLDEADKFWVERGAR